MMSDTHEEIELAPRRSGAVRASLSDMAQAFRAWRLWIVLGFHDMRAQYSRSHLGPFWQTAHAAIWIGSLAFIFTNVFKVEQDRNHFIMYIAIGLVLFNYINAIVTGAADVFVRSRIMIHAHPAPIFIHPLRLVSAAVFQLAFQLLAVLGVYALFPIPLAPTAPLALVGLAMTGLMSISMSTLLAIAGARFGDFRFALLAVMRLMFFVTPIFWTLDQWTGAPLQLVTLNPITNYITIVRDPLLGKVPDLLVYVKALFWLVAATIAGAAWFVRTRQTIAMWV